MNLKSNEIEYQSMSVTTAIKVAANVDKITFKKRKPIYLEWNSPVAMIVQAVEQEHFRFISVSVVFG